MDSYVSDIERSEKLQKMYMFASNILTVRNTPLDSLVVRTAKHHMDRAKQQARRIPVDYMIELNLS